MHSPSCHNTGPSCAEPAEPGHHVDGIGAAGPCRAQPGQPCGHQDLLPLPQLADRRELRSHPAERLGRHCRRARAWYGRSDARGQRMKVTWHGLEDSAGLRVLDGLISGHSLLSSSQRQQMDGNCLGWDCSLTGTASYVGKGGDSAAGAAALHTFFGIIAGTIPVVVVINSDLGATNPNSGEDLTSVVATALFAATSYR